MLNDRLRWILFRRRNLIKSIAGFSASPLSYATVDCQFEGFNRLTGHAVLQDSRLGSGSYVNSARLNTARVGRFCSIGIDALVGLGDHPVDRIATHPAFYSPHDPIGLRWVTESSVNEQSLLTIGNDVWIGARAIVLGGLKIGDGAIVAAGAVVTKDVERYSIVAGTPARTIRMRFDQETCKQLIDMRWWDTPSLRLSMSAREIGAVPDRSTLKHLKSVVGPDRDKPAW